MTIATTGDVTATAVAPLTTKFNPAPSCLRDLYLEVTSMPSEPIPGGYSWVHLGHTTSDSACVPSGWAPEVYYSPAICPSSYTLGCDPSTHTFSNSLTEYRATCCPIGYACRMAEDASLYPWATIDPCTVRDITTTVALLTYNTTQQPPATTHLSVSNYYQALGVSIRWQPSDSLPVQTGPPTITSTTSATSTTASLTSTSITSHSVSSTTIFTSTSTSTTSSTNVSAPPAPVETHSALPSSDSSPSSSGLSSGAKAGLGVGVAIAGVLIISAAVFFFYIRPRRNNNKLQDQGSGGKKSELDAAVPVHELGSSAVNELEGSYRVIHEIGDSSRVELKA